MILLQIVQRLHAAEGARTPMVWKENRENAYCEITPAILALKEQWEKKNYIDPKLYKEYTSSAACGTRTAAACSPA